MQIFIVENGELIINRPEVLLYPSLHKILMRDKDRYKKQAFREFAYIYFTTDPEAVPYKYGYNEDETEKYAIENSKLDKDWTPDEIVIEAQKEYKHVNGSVIKDVIKESLIAFRNYSKVTKLIRKHIDKLLYTAEEAGELSVDEINKLMNYTVQLLEIGNTIPAVKDKLNMSLKAVERSMDIDNDDDLVRGTTEKVPSSFDPERDFGHG